MKTYPTKKIGEVCDVSSGDSAPQDQALFKNGTFPFFRTSDVGKVHISKNLVSPADFLNDAGVKKLRLFPQGTILFPKSGASTFINHRAMIGRAGYVSSHLATLKARENLLDDYLFYFLLTTDAKDLAKNPAYPSLKVSDIQRVEIPVPPIAEQRKIVEKIDRQFAKIDEAARLRAESVALAEKLLSAALHEIFSSPESKGWEIKNVTECFEKISVGKQWSKKEGVPDGKVPILDQSQDGVFAYHNENPNIHASEESPVVTFANHTTAVRYVTYNFSVIQNVFPLRALPGVSPRYLYYAIIGVVDQDGYKGHWPLFVQKEIPLPPLAEQKKIVKKLDTLSEKARALRDLQYSQSADLKSLKQSILHEAFSVKM